MPAPAGHARRRRSVNLRKILIYTVLSLFCLSTVLAFAWVFMISLKTTQEFLSTSPWALPQKPHFDNYVIAWNKAKIGSFFLNSIIAAGLGASGSVLVSALAAYVIARINFKFNNLLANYFIVGYMVPIMLTVIPLYAIMVRLGMSAGLLPLTLLYIASGVPFNTFVLRGFFETLPGELEEAATVDGASPFRAFWQIMLPLSWAGLVSTFLINFMSLWNEFFLALIFLNKETATMPLGLFYMAQRAEYTAQWSDLFAGILMATVPILIVFALLQDQVTRGMTAGAIKG
jgi:raffinose/stachyose/melibiose transport system permease protein/N-acetylglucosamine transport system permease protein